MFTKFLQLEIFRFPLLFSQLTGSFPLSVKQRLINGQPDVIFIVSLINPGICTLILRIALIVEIIRASRVRCKEFAIIRGEWSHTLLFAEITVNIIIHVGDIYCAYLAVVRRQRMSAFFTSLARLLGDLWRKINNADDSLERKFMRKYKYNVKWPFWYIFFLSICSFWVGLFLIVPNVSNLYPDWAWGKLEVALLLFYMDYTLLFRFLSLFILASILFLLQIGFSMLASHVDHCGTAEQVVFVLENFDKLENLLKEFHLLFNFQLISGAVTILLSLLAAGFNEIVMIMVSPRDYMAIVSVYPWAFALALTFYILCNLATGLTSEAKNCVWAFRTSPGIDSLPGDMQDKLLLFFIEKTTKPPTVSPGNCFRLGCHILPTVQTQLLFVCINYSNHKIMKVYFNFLNRIACRSLG